MGGPQAFMPVQAKYVQTGDRTWSNACVAMLKKKMGTGYKKTYVP